jgi:hypothetical protein
VLLRAAAREPGGLGEDGMRPGVRPADVLGVGMLMPAR